MSVYSDTLEYINAKISYYNGMPNCCMPMMNDGGGRKQEIRIKK